MLLTLIYLVIFYSLLQSTVSANRKILVVFVLVFYSLFTLVDLYYIEQFLHTSFHPSDPTNYYVVSLKISFKEIFELDSSNTFYYIINWFYNHIYPDSTFISLLVKLNNVFVILLAYLLITRKLPNMSVLDCLILFNPYLLMTIIRNVRDPYIILFVSVILIALGAFPGSTIERKYVILCIILLALTRFVLLLPLFLIWLSKFGRKSIPIYVVIMFFCISYFDVIWMHIIHQTVSALSAIGEDITELKPLIDGDFSFSILIHLLGRLFIGLISFLFTPHPVNYWCSWISEMQEYGSYNIYTGIDNFLIWIGSIYAYLLVLPISLNSILRLRKENSVIYAFIILYIIIYTLAYIGVTDIRNRHFAFFFILIGLQFLKNNSFQAVYKLRYVFYTLILFIGIMLI